MADWWLAGGIDPANCVAAYQAIGAESYAASLVNLANPGTNDLTAPAGAMPWDAVNGWNGNLTYYLDTGYKPNNTHVTILVRTKAIGGGSTRTLFGVTGPGNAMPGINLQYYWNVDGIRYGNKRYNMGNPPFNGVNNGVFAVSKDGAYLNGELRYPFPDTIAPFSRDYSIFINARNNGGTTVEIAKYDILAFAIYDTALTSAQIAAVSAAMNGNEPEPQTNIPVFMAHYRRLRSQ